MIEEDIPKEKTQTYKTPNDIHDDIESGTVERVEKAWNYINKYLYSKRLTKIDTRDLIDTTDIEEDNESAEL